MYLVSFVFLRFSIKETSWLIQVKLMSKSSLNLCRGANLYFEDIKIIFLVKYHKNSENESFVNCVFQSLHETLMWSR